MKRIIPYLILGFTCIVTACSDDEEVMNQATTNDPPSDFSSLAPGDGEEGVTLLPLHGLNQ